MSQIEFSAQASKTFSVQLYNATTGVAIGSPLTPTESPAGSGRYRVSTGSNTGIVYVLATATNLKVDGYANLDRPMAHAYSSVLGSYEDALAGFLLDTINGKVASIGTGSPQTNAPVTNTGVIKPIIIGDDYLAANGRAFSWTIAPVPGLTIGTATSWFGLQAVQGKVPQHVGSWQVQGASITVDVNGKWVLSFDVDKAKTGACQPGLYDWSVAVHGTSGSLAEITQVRAGDNRVLLVTKQTP